MTTWYEAKTGNHQGLVIEEETGRNVAVTYDKVDAPLVAAAPEMLAALEAALTPMRGIRRARREPSPPAPIIPARMSSTCPMRIGAPSLR